MRKLRSAAAEPGGAEVLHRDDARIAGELEACLHEALLEERVADLHRRPARGAAGVEHDRCEARAVDAVASGVGAHEQHEVARPARDGAHHPVLLDDPDAHRVDEQLVRYDSSKYSSPPTVGTPMQLPYPPMPATTPSKRCR